MHKIKHLEGLRGLAALIVFMSHLVANCFLNEYNNLVSHLNNNILNSVLFVFFRDGDLAVWVFWVLSSYVISIAFFKKNTDYDKILIGYFSKRYIRLALPVLVTVFISYILLYFNLMYNIKLSNILGETYKEDWLPKFYNFKPNILIAIKSALYETFFNFNIQTTYNTSLWSLQNEFLGSLFTFGLFGIIRHNKKRYILYSIILFTTLYLKLAWLFVFTFGHVLCDYENSIIKNHILIKIKKIEQNIIKHNLIVFIISVLFIILLGGGGLFNLLKITIETKHINFILSMFIVYICIKNKYFQLIFSSKIFYKLGNISFSLYLLHIPILCSLTSYLVYMNPTFKGKIFASIITIIVIFPLSILFTKFIDNTSVKLANKISDYFKN